MLGTLILTGRKGTPMSVTQHIVAWRPVVRSIFAGGALAVALVLSGCSAASMTGFDFPAFGLTKKPAEEGIPQTTEAMPQNDLSSGIEQQRATTQ